ncbi:late competence development ComFB family protein [Bowmanella denitrificans]|uniref:late competence development ComFB family protein n=1 Tax=Bowmanella denitrificans TaxID=366582 RepID=UPI000C9B5025|nr:late competence development ComFB family protein [Bowmanella denitrificans]
MKLDDDIHNYYEHLVLERIEKLGLHNSQDEDFLADLSCLTLNQCPARYIRFEVDMAFYISQSERQQMEMNVSEAMDKALKYLQSDDAKKKAG